MGNTYNRVYIWCCKYGENRYCERCPNKKVCASKHTGLLNSCLGKLCLHPYLVVPLISARVTLISTRVSAHCQAILLQWHHIGVMASRMFLKAYIKENTKAVRYWPFVKGIRRDRWKKVLLDDVIQNGWRNLVKSRGTSSLKIVQSCRLWPWLLLYFGLRIQPSALCSVPSGQRRPDGGH